MREGWCSVTQCVIAGGLRMFASVCFFLWLTSGAVQAYSNEVYLSGSTYRWKISNVEVGSTADLATAITNCVWNSTGTGREIHVLVGGTLASTIGLPPDVKLMGHGNTFTISHGGYGIYCKGVNNITMQDMTLTGGTNMIFRITACDNVTLSGININGGYIGMRLESSNSNHPWDFTSYNLKVTNCQFENLGSHGIETYGIDGAQVDGIVAKNNGECGVLFNNTRNAVVGTVDAYRCSNGGGYAGLRFANDCANATVKYLRAIECGRGFFAVTGAKNIVVEEVYIRDCTSHAILIQNSDGVGINSGTYNGTALNHYTSINSWILATDATGVTATVPAAPSVPVITTSTTGISLTWPAVSGATNYLLQRSTSSSGPFVGIASQEMTTFLDRNATPGTTYYYQVRAMNAAGPGDPSPAVSVTAPTTVPNVSSGLSLRYAFDGSRAESSGGPSVTVTGTESYVAGELNQALAFDGTSTYATLPTLTSADYREFTATAWIWQSSTSDWQRFFDLGNSTSNYIILTRVGTMLRFDICQNGVLQILQTTAPPLDRWVHVAVTFTGNWATLYLNGSPVKSIFYSINPSQISMTQNYLGKSRFSDPLLKGRLDDVRFYTRGLSNAEINSLVMNAPPLKPFDVSGGGFGTKAGLQWSSVVNATSYSVKRSTTSGGPYTVIASGLTSTSYWDTTVQSGTTYYYIVTATNAQGESPASDQTTVVVSDLVARLKFDESSGTVASDFSGNNWNATLVNSPVWSTGNFGNALQFPATAAQYADLPDGIVSGLADYTISMWVYVPAFSNWARAFDFGTGTSNYMFLAPQYATGTSAAKPRFAIRTTSVTEQTITSSIALPTATWAHVAVTLSGTTGRLYINGALAGTNTAMTLKPSDLGSTTLNYLARSQFNDPYLNGSLDDFRIYARALNGTEIATLADPPATSPLTLTAIPGDTRNTLSWDAADGATFYNVKRATTSGGPYTVIATGVVGMTYDDTALTNGTTYYYIVTGTNTTHWESTTSSPEASSTPSSLRLYLKMDDVVGTTTADASGRGATVTLVNSPGSISGRLGDAIQFQQASSQYATLPSGIVSDLTTTTIMCWVRTTSISSWQRIFDFGTSTANYMFLTTQYGTGGNANKLRFGIRTTSTAEELINSSVATPANTWVHVALVLNGSTGTLYLNGTQVGQNTAMTLNPSSLGVTTANYLGKSQFSDPYLNASLDDFRIYSRAMSASEIALFASPLAAPQNVLATANPLAISLSWSSVANASGYTVKSSPASEGPFSTLVSNLATTSYVNTGLAFGLTRYYIITAWNSAGESEGSATVSATASSPPIQDSEKQAPGFSMQGTSSAYITVRNSVAGHTYTLQASQTMAPGDWHDVASPIPGSGGDLQFTIPVDPSVRSRFFRFNIDLQYP
jgi:fibronectin type 3 domain-containing protein